MGLRDPSLCIGLWLPLKQGIKHFCLDSWKIECILCSSEWALVTQQGFSDICLCFISLAIPHSFSLLKPYMSIPCGISWVPSIIWLCNRCPLYLSKKFQVINYVLKLFFCLINNLVFWTVLIKNKFIVFMIHPS